MDSGCVSTSMNSVVVFLCVWCSLCIGLIKSAGGGGGGLEQSFITWDDLKVDNKDIQLYWKEDRLNRRKPVIVVDQNGGGDSTTVQAAVDMVPENNLQRVKIFILPGVYREKVRVPRSKPFISFIGNENQPSQTVISWNNKASDKNSTGSELGTCRSASVSIESDYFCASGITFENTVVAVPGGYGMQAVALGISGDKAMFYKVRILGSQDTLLDEFGAHFFLHSVIQGSIDFIFGKARSLFQNCLLHSIARGSGAVAAHHRDSPTEDSGFSFVNCTISGTGQIFLGRAWGNYSRIVYSFCNFHNVITPSGWNDWNVQSRQKTVEFGEYMCRGEGANRSGRVPWARSFRYDQVKPFLDMTFIDGENWLRL